MGGYISNPNFSDISGQDSNGLKDATADKSTTPEATNNTSSAGSNQVRPKGRAALCGWCVGPKSEGKQTKDVCKKRSKKQLPGRTGEEDADEDGEKGAKDADDKQALSTSSIRKERLRRLKEQRPQLTDRQLEVIVQTWGVLQSDLDKVGSEMFVKMFETYPDVKGAFGPFKSMRADDVRLGQELRAHGLRVLSTISRVLEKRENTEDVVQHLYDLGCKHITFNAKSEYIDIVSQQFLFAVEPVLKEHWTPEVEQAWADLFRLIAHVMREGMIL